MGDYNKGINDVSKTEGASISAKGTGSDVPTGAGEEIERSEDLTEEGLETIHKAEGKEAAGECEGSDIEKVEKLYPDKQEELKGHTPAFPKTSVILSQDDFAKFKELNSKDFAWGQLVKVHNTDLLNKQAEISLLTKEFWRGLVTTYGLDMTSNFVIDLDTGEVKEVPRIQKGMKKNV
jgi:hypothetical protein